MSKRAHTCPFSESYPIHSGPCHSLCLIANFIPSHQCTDLPSCLFASGFLTKTVYSSLLHHVCHALNSAYLSCVYTMLCCIYGLHRDTQQCSHNSGELPTAVIPKCYIHGSVHRESNLVTVPTRCDLFSLLHFHRQLYMYRVLTPIIRSWYSCNYSF